MKLVGPQPRRIAVGPALVVLALALWTPGVLAFSGGRAYAAAARATITQRAAIPAVKVGPPAHGIYHAAYPDFVGSEDKVSAGRIRRFERLAGKRLAWVYFSDNWMGDIRFPAKNVAIIHGAGRMPFIRLMARSTWREGGPDPMYTMQRILDGEYDADLTRWFANARDTGIPLMVEFGTEVDGDWFPWNGRWNGGGVTTGYGDPLVADGPERFRDAYRHLVDLSRAAGAGNLTWVYHVNGDSWPRKPWNTPAAYYPGDDYVDWIGVSIYGSQGPGEFSGSFRRLLDDVYPKLRALSPDKPLAVLEWGIAQRPARGTKAGWIHHALYWLGHGHWPRVKAASYWHEDWRESDGSLTNLRIDSSSAACRAYRHGVAAGFFTSRTVFVTP
jgi:uncharacterized glyoxalase superfamily protein PhnB